MAEKMTSQPMRGMRDLLPAQVSLRKAVIEKIRTVYARHGFSEIETPVVERIELLNTGEGGDNEKMIFMVQKRGLTEDAVHAATAPRDLVDGGLRYDLTVPLARYVAEHRGQLLFPFKALQIGNVFRAERSQKGRYRQFMQCDIDIIGDATVLAERELLSATTEVLMAIGFSGFTLRINDRRILQAMADSCGYTATMHDAVFIIIDKLDKIGIAGVADELRSLGDARAAEQLVSLLESVCACSQSTDLFALLPESCESDVIADVRAMVESLTEHAAGRYQIQFDPTLVRGMGYYTGTIFEIVDRDFPSSIAGGGRYDNMIGKYAGDTLPACGFSIGFERVIALLEEREHTLVNTVPMRALLFDTDVSIDAVLVQAARLRKEGPVAVFARKKNTTHQITTLAAHGYTEFARMQSDDDIPVCKPIV